MLQNAEGSMNLQAMFMSYYVIKVLHMFCDGCVLSFMPRAFSLTCDGDWRQDWWVPLAGYLVILAKILRKIHTEFYFDNEIICYTFFFFLPLTVKLCVCFTAFLVHCSCRGKVALAVHTTWEPKFSVQLHRGSQEQFQLRENPIHFLLNKQYEYSKME